MWLSAWDDRYREEAINMKIQGIREEVEGANGRDTGSKWRRFVISSAASTPEFRGHHWNSSNEPRLCQENLRRSRNRRWVWRRRTGSGPRRRAGHSLGFGFTGVLRLVYFHPRQSAVGSRQWLMLDYNICLFPFYLPQGLLFIYLLFGIFPFRMDNALTLLLLLFFC